jgi:hypothetical protein
MDTLPASIRDLVQKILAANQTASDPHAQEAVRLVDSLRIQLTTLAGADGFTALVRRALALASAETPALKCIKLGPDGHLEGMEMVAPDAAVALAAHLLGLLVTFIGEPLTLRLVREAWPDASLDE